VAVYIGETSMRQLTVALFAVLVCSLAFTSSEAQDLMDSLVLAFSFEEGAGNTVKDMAQQGNDAKIEGNPSWVNGKLGKALQFDGKTYVVAPHIPFNDKDFTVQLWAKPAMISDGVMFSQHELNSANLSLHLRVHPDGVVRMGFYSNDLDTPAGAVQKDNWHNLTFMFDTSTTERKIYVDGVEAAADASGTPYLGATGDTRVGGWERPSKAENPLYQIYYGAIDEVRVWSRLLTEEEILLSMETEMAVEPDGKMTAMWGAIKTSN
jgi:hypothetical protein